MGIRHNTAFLFPSAENVSPGVCKEDYEKYPTIREYFDIAGDIHKYDFKRYLLGEGENLNCPSGAELCTMLVSLCKYTIWMAETGLVPELFTGLSLGLYTSVVAANSLSFADSFLLLKRSMEQGLSLSGKMVVLFGVTYDEANQLCQQSSVRGRVRIANSIMQNQVAVCGDDEGIEQFFDNVKFINMRYKIIYDGQFHVDALDGWSSEMGVLMKGMEVRDPEVPILFLYNLTQANSKDDVRSFLSKQISSEVKWYEAVNMMIDSGFEQFVEFGPGNLLTKMIKIDNSDVYCQAIGDLNAIDTVYKTMVGADLRNKNPRT